MKVRHKRMWNLLRLSVVLWLGLLFLAACASVVKYQLKQTIHSLPPAPPGSLLLFTSPGDASGSDCVGYYVHWLYGSQQPIEQVLDYYYQVLIEQDWVRTSSEEYIAQGYSEYERKRGESFSILPPDDIQTQMDLELAIRDGILSKSKLDEYATVFMIRVAHTCNYRGG